MESAGEASDMLGIGGERGDARSIGEVDGPEFGVVGREDECFIAERSGGGNGM